METQAASLVEATLERARVLPSDSEQAPQHDIAPDRQSTLLDLRSQVQIARHSTDGGEVLSFTTM